MDWFKTLSDGFAAIFQTTPTPLAVLAGIIVFGALAIYLARDQKRLLVGLAVLALIVPSIVLVYIIGTTDSPKWVLLKQLDGRFFDCTITATGAACLQPAGVTPGKAYASVVLKLHNENPHTTFTYGDVPNPDTKTIGNEPPDCSQPLPKVNLPGVVSDGGKKIEWINGTTWSRK